MQHMALNGGVTQRTVMKDTLRGIIAVNHHGLCHKQHLVVIQSQRLAPVSFQKNLMYVFPVWKISFLSLLHVCSQYIILNLGLSPGFQQQDFMNMQFPARYYVDYVRVYQREGVDNIGCDPPDFPTADYIQK